MIAEKQVEIQSAWDRIASGYDEYVTPTHMALSDEAHRQSGLRPGMRFLDVAAGSGSLGITAARLGAQVLATDLSPAMLERLKSRTNQEGLANVETRVMDGHNLDLEDATFDVSGSQFGVMLFPDMPRGIRELARVTKAGGRVVMIVYGPPSEIDFLQFFVGAVQTAVPGFNGLPSDPPPLPLQLQDPVRLRREMEAAGLKDVRVDTTTERLAFRSGEELWNWLCNSNPIVDAIFSELQVSDAQSSIIRKELDERIRDRAAGGAEAVLVNTVHIGVGMK